MNGMRNLYISCLVALVLVPVIRVSLFQRRRDPQAYASVDSNNLVQIVAVVGMAVVVGGRGAMVTNRLVAIGPTCLLVLYSILCGLSALWSPQPAYTAYRAVEIGLVLLCMGHVLYTVNNPGKALLWLSRFAALTAMLGYLGDVRSYGGLFQHTNSYTAIGAVGAVLILGSIKKGVLSLAEVKYSLAACIATVILGTSSASNVSLAVGILAVAGASRGITSMARVLVVSAFAFLLLWAGLEMVQPYLFPGKDIEQIRTMRGRTGLFLTYWEAFQQNPVLGYSFAVGERSIMGPGTNWTHNSVVSVAVNTGAIGLVMFIGGYLTVLYALYRADRFGSPFAFPVAIAILVGFLNSMSYPLIGSIWTGPTSAFMGVVVYTSIYLSPVVYSGLPFCCTGPGSISQR